MSILAALENNLLTGNAFLTVRVFAGRETPYTAWIYHEPDGSGFSDARKFAAVPDAVLDFYRRARRYDNPPALLRALRVKLEHWQGDDADGQPVISSELTDIDAILNRAGLRDI